MEKIIPESDTHNEKQNKNTFQWDRVTGNVHIFKKDISVKAPLRTLDLKDEKKPNA